MTPEIVNNIRRGVKAGAVSTQAALRELERSLPVLSADIQAKRRALAVSRASMQAATDLIKELRGESMPPPIIGNGNIDDRQL